MIAKILKRGGLACALAYVLALVALTAGQRRLQYAPHAPPPTSVPDGMAEITIQSGDRVRLMAWVGQERRERAALLLHGNGGTRENMGDVVRGFLRWGYRPLVLDYRGYGGSEGSPTEKGLYADAQAAWDWLEEQGASTIVVWGFSLGSGVAVHTARHNPAAALILDAPFDSAVHLGQLRYPWLPVSLVLWDRYESDQKIDRIDCPLLIIHGERDITIPIALGRALFDRAREPKTFVSLADAGHNDLRRVASERYWSSVVTFLRAVDSSSMEQSLSR